MDLEGQGRIKQVVEQAGADDVIAVLGANSAAAVEMTAITLKSGDPSYAGPLTGIALGIPSYHILESEIGPDRCGGLRAGAGAVGARDGRRAGDRADEGDQGRGSLSPGMTNRELTPVTASWRHRSW